MLENKRGITLIALVITIIVLLILAGVSIAMLTGNNGILTQANNAKAENEKAKLNEEAELDMSDTYIQTQQVKSYEITERDSNYSDWTTDGKGTITKYTGDLTEIIIPSKIGDEVITCVGKDKGGYPIFDENNIKKITKITISKGIRKIKYYAFGGCTELNKIIIPDTVDTIEDFSLTSTNIKSIIIPEGVKEMLGNMTLSHCENLRAIKFPSTLQKLGSNYFIGSGFTKLELPNNLKEIGICCIWECPNVEEVYIPKSVTTVAWGGVGACPNLKKVYCEAESKPDGWSNDWLTQCPNAEVVWGYKK